ncbi:hypothetical protein HDU79_010270 [Rhizoclosmatium sp. JEL0117]|nr:hypothetical protein HDU79_010270 [Rhizoclosmatium sp. JEL0117]
MTQVDPFAFDSAPPAGHSQGSGLMADDTRLLNAPRIVPASAGKTIATGDLVARLKELHFALARFEQETVDVSSLASTAKNLVSPSLTQHRDKAVRALAACCLADVLRLCAPDAPYTAQELRVVFALFVSQLHGVADPNGPYFEHHYYLLESLAAVKSIVLLTDLDADDLVTSLFKDVYGFMRQDFQKNVYGFLLQLLQCLVEESQSLNNDIIETIITQFDKVDRLFCCTRDLATDHAILLPQPNNQMSRQLSIDLCNNVTDKLQRYVCQYFGELFYSSMKSITRTRAESFDDEDDEDARDAAASHAEFQHAHRMIVDMNHSCRGILLNVIPLFEDQLKCEDDKVRELSTDVLGKIFVDSGSNVAVVYPAIWRVWLERRNDKSPAIRILWIQFCNDVYRHHHELCAEVTAGLRQKFCDPDDKVRLAAIKVMGLLDSVSLVNIPRDLLLDLADRCKDKKMPIRIEAIQALSNIFKITYADIVSDENQAAEKYGWIPGCLLELVYLGDIETNIVMERALHEDIFVYSYDDVQRTDRLLRIVGALTEKQYKAFLNVIDRQASMSKDFMMYIEMCENWNGGIMDRPDKALEENLNKLILHISSKFPDAKKAATSLQRFSKNNENRVYKLFRGLMNESADFKTITKNGKEIMKRMEPYPGLPETFVVILRRVSLTLLGKSSIPRLIEVARSYAARQNQSTMTVDTTVDHEMSRLAVTAENLIKKLAVAFPGVYGSHLKEFLGLLVSNDESLVSDSLEGLARFVKTFPKDLELNKTEQAVVKKYAIHGTIRQAKHAATILALLSDSTPRRNVINQIGAALQTKDLVPKFITEYEKIKLEQLDDDSFTMSEMPLHKLPTWLSSVSQFALYSRAEFDTIQQVVNDLLVRECLLKSSFSDMEDDPHLGQDWVDWDVLHAFGVVKVLAVKCLVNRVRGAVNAGEGEEAVAVLARPVYKVLNRIVEGEGEVVPKGGTCDAFKSHLRQVAAISLLKLAKLPGCDSILTVLDRNRLMLSIQDPCWQTRDAFVERLRKYLQQQSIPYRYIVILCMAALEPDDDIRIKAKSFLTRFAKASKDVENASTLESVFVDVLHMVAHHPDFGTEPDDISLSAKYIQFFIDIVATANNASFLFHSAAQLKTLIDLYSTDGSSESLYHISDLAQFLIQEHCKHHLWTLNSYPDVIPYKRELFKRMGSSKESNENIKMSYLSKKWMESTQSANSVKTKSSSSRRKSSLGKAERERLAAVGQEDDDEDDDDEDSEDDDEDAAPKRKRKAAAGRRRKTSGEGVATKRGSRKRKSDASAEDEEIIPRAKSSRTAKTGKKYTEKELEEEEEDAMDVDENDEDEDEDSEDEEEPLVKPKRKAALAKSPAAKSPAAKSPASKSPTLKSPVTKALPKVSNNHVFLI